MSLTERYKYLRLLQSDYLSADRGGRGRLLDQAERVTGLHRKSLSRLLRGKPERRRRTRQRGRTYSPAVESAVRLVARSLDYPCAERLQPALVSQASYLAQHGELELLEGLLEARERISLSTVGRMVQRMRRDGHLPRLARSRPSPPNPLTRSIPADRLPRHLPQPGSFEVDLVHHCEPSADGQYVHTLQLIDVATGWSERVAIHGRSYRVLQNAFERILARLPFPILELHPDNGVEFFNHFLLAYWKQAVPQLSLSRSRPYHKNDNRLVEEKNGSLVRGYIGFARLDIVAQTRLLNQIYDQMWLLHNVFHPVMRLKPDPVLAGHRRHDRPVPAFDRLCRTGALPADRQSALAALRVATNPLRLREDVHARLDRLNRLPGAKPSKPQDVQRALFVPGIPVPQHHTPVTSSIEGSTLARQHCQST